MKTLSLTHLLTKLRGMSEQCPKGDIQATQTEFLNSELLADSTHTYRRFPPLLEQCSEAGIAPKAVSNQLPLSVLQGLRRKRVTVYRDTFLLLGNLKKAVSGRHV